EGGDDPVAGGEAAALRALPGHPHPHGASPRHAQVRRRLHVRHLVPRGGRRDWCRATWWATWCPAECIYIEAGERPEKTIEKYPTRFEIDLLRCVYCGFCVDGCPEEGVFMRREEEP